VEENILKGTFHMINLGFEITLKIREK
jgi:hypothetical protein